MPRAFRTALLIVLTLLVFTFPKQMQTRSSASEAARVGRTSWDTQGLEEQRQELTALLRLREEKLGTDGATALAGPLVATANKYGWDPLMILAVMEIESNLEPAARSYAGAVGLMQLIPYVAAHQAEEAGIYYDGKTSLHNTATNLELGVRYLSELRSKYGNNPRLYLTAYNLGPTKLDQRLRGDGQHWFTYADKILRRYARLRGQMQDVRAYRAGLLGEQAG